MKGSGAPALNISTTTQSELRHDKWPHPRVRTSPEVGPGATVGTPGLGYPLLLCLGRGLVVILNCLQTAGPRRSEVLFFQLWSGPVPRLGRVRRHHVSRKRQELVCKQPGLRTSQGDRTPHGVPDPRGVPDPSLKEEIDTLRRGGLETPRVCKIWPFGFPY